MLYLAYISIFFVICQLVNAAMNLVYRQKPANLGGSDKTLVSVLIPARNEENNIGNSIESLLALEDKNIEILVFDDQSTDSTASIVESYSKKDPRVLLIRSDGLPKGWMGKNYACHSLAQKARGEYFLFIDADVKLYSDIIGATISSCEKNGLSLFSAFPKQIMVNTGEKISVPIMNYILLTLLPLVFVRVSPFSSHSAANGQFMMFSAKEYKKWLPHQKFKECAIEDLAISSFFKKNGIKTACIGGDERITCRMYQSYGDALKGFTKNIFMFFGGNPLLAILFWCFTTLGFIPVLALPTKFIILYLLSLILTRILVSLASRQAPITNILLMPLQQLFLAHVILNASILKFTKRYSWKGREIYS